MKNIIVSLLVVGVVGGGIYYFTQSNKKDTVENIQGDSSSEEKKVPLMEGEVKVLSMNDLFDLSVPGKSYQCSVEMNQKIAGMDMTSSGTIYISNQKFSGETATKIGLMNTTTNIIADGDYIYVWNSATSTGTKMKQENPEMLANNYKSQMTAQLPEGYTAPDVTCNPWKVDASKFIPPTSVSFTLINAPKNP